MKKQTSKQRNMQKKENEKRNKGKKQTKKHTSKQRNKHAKEKKKEMWTDHWYQRDPAQSFSNLISYHIISYHIIPYIISINIGAHFFFFNLKTTKNGFKLNTPPEKWERLILLRTIKDRGCTRYANLKSLQPCVMCALIGWLRYADLGRWQTSFKWRLEQGTEHEALCASTMNFYVCRPCLHQKGVHAEVLCLVDETHTLLFFDFLLY